MAVKEAICPVRNVFDLKVWFFPELLHIFHCYLYSSAFRLGEYIWHINWNKTFIFLFLRIIWIFQRCGQNVADRTFPVHCLCKGLVQHTLEWAVLLHTFFTAQVINLEHILICHITSGDLLLHVTMLTETVKNSCYGYSPFSLPIGSSAFHAQCIHD